MGSHIILQLKEKKNRAGGVDQLAEFLLRTHKPWFIKLAMVICVFNLSTWRWRWEFKDTVDYVVNLKQAGYMKPYIK